MISCRVETGTHDISPLSRSVLSAIVLSESAETSDPSNNPRTRQIIFVVSRSVLPQGIRGWRHLTRTWTANWIDQSREREESAPIPEATAVNILV